jgi:hypothetical protein
MSFATDLAASFAPIARSGNFSLASVGTGWELARLLDDGDVVVVAQGQWCDGDSPANRAWAAATGLNNSPVKVTDRGPGLGF